MARTQDESSEVVASGDNPGPQDRKPPYHGTRLRVLRVEDELWDAARATAEARGESVSEVLRACLRRYIKRHGTGSGQA